MPSLSIWTSPSQVSALPQHSFACLLLVHACLRVLIHVDRPELVAGCRRTGWRSATS